MSPVSSPSSPFPCLFAGALVLAAIGVAPLAAVAKPAGSKAELREMKREYGADATASKSVKRDDNSVSSGRSSAGDAQSRTMAKLRERLNVTDDAEWDIISERIVRVEELRRNLWTGGATSRSAITVSDKGKRTTKSAHPEQDALKSALNDKLPNAEIEARLTRAREVYRQNEFKLARAQAELRAVLSVRQEAEAVVAGILPP